MAEWPESVVTRHARAIVAGQHTSASGDVAEQLARIAEVPKVEFMRRGINQHPLEKICERQPLRAIKIADCLKALEEWESHKAVNHEVHRTAKC